MCGEHTPIVKAIDLSSWSTLINSIAKDLHTGKLKPSDLHPELIEKTYEQLEEGAAAGYGKKWFSLDNKNASTVQNLKQNIYHFSGAKTYQQLAEMNSFLVDENGKIRSFSAFKRKVEVVHKKYNQNYLQAEYQTARRASQAARQWKDFQANKDLFPNLKYMTIGDDKVRHEHAKLHGVIRPIDDPFWDTHYPPNGWRCRCYVKATAEDANSTKIDIQPEKGFGINVGKMGQIYDANDHPYFVYPSSDQKAVQKAFENFKINAPYGKARYTAKNGSKVFVSPFSDANPRELIGNYKVAVKIADQLNVDVKLRPHINGSVILKKSNPEYLIDGELADRKSPSGSRLRSILSKAKRQNIAILVLDLQHSLRTFEDIIDELAGRLKDEKNYKNIKQVILVSKNRKVVTKYDRNEIKKSKG